MRYTISEMATLLGVTTHMLRHYEKLGIIKPEVNEENGYRYFSVIDTRRFILSRRLLSSGIPLEKCAEIMSSMPISDIQTLIDEKIMEQRKQIERMKIILQYLEKTKDAYETLDQRVGKISIENYPRMWRLNLSENEKAYISAELQKEKEEWLECLPAVFWVSRIPNQILSQFSEGIIDYGYGLMCYEQNAKALGLKKRRM